MNIWIQKHNKQTSVDFYVVEHANRSILNEIYDVDVCRAEIVSADRFRVVSYFSTLTRETTVNTCNDGTASNIHTCGNPVRDCALNPRIWCNSSQVSHWRVEILDLWRIDFRDMSLRIGSLPYAIWHDWNVAKNIICWAKIYLVTIKKM